MKQILIIEDELDIQELLRTYLEDARLWNYSSWRRCGSPFPYFMLDPLT